MQALFQRKEACCTWWSTGRPTAASVYSAVVQDVMIQPSVSDSDATAKFPHHVKHAVRASTAALLLVCLPHVVPLYFCAAFCPLMITAASALCMACRRRYG